MWRDSESLAETIRHFHWYRYLVAYPGLWLEQFLPGTGFSVYICCFVATNALLFRSIAILARNRPPNALAWTIFLASHLAMNGRGAIGWCGWLLCMHLCMRCYFGRHGTRCARSSFLLLAVCSLICSTVTSGVFLATMTAMVSFPVVQIAIKSASGVRPRVPRVTPSDLLVIPIVVAILILAVEYLLEAAAKAVAFYGGGIDGAIGVATHGFGSLFTFNFEQIVLGMTIAPVLTTLLLLLAAIRRGQALLPFLLIPVVGGVAGYIILTLAIPAALILALRRVPDRLVSLGPLVASQSPPLGGCAHPSRPA